MKKSKLPSLVTILILSVITVVLWISFNVYRSFTIKPSPPVDEAISNPLNPTLNLDIIGKIQSRIYLDDSQIPDSVVVLPTPEPIEPEVTPTVEPTPTPATTEEVATESGVPTSP